MKNSRDKTIYRQPNAVCYSAFLHLHERPINGVIIAPRSVLVVVAKTAVGSMPPFSGTATVCAVRDPVGTRRVTNSPPEADAVGVGALLLITADRLDSLDRQQRITPVPNGSTSQAISYAAHGQERNMRYSSRYRHISHK